MTKEQSDKLKQAAYKHILETGFGPSYDDFIAGAEYWAQNQWVPVTEKPGDSKLPENKGVYDVTCQVRDIETPPFTDVMAFVPEVGWLNKWANVKVTAWRERPAPYSPKQQTNE